MRLPCDLPVVQAPLAGGPWTPQLTAAVVDAGGYGFVAAGYLSADALRRAMAQTELLTDKPYGVNLFVPAQPGDPVEVDRYAKLPNLIASGSAYHSVTPGGRTMATGPNSMSSSRLAPTS